jgi:molybdopterin/thiamine biosynthesis adenylyltransferase
MANGTKNSGVSKSAFGDHGNVVFYRLANPTDRNAFEMLLTTHPSISRYDTLISQLRDLVKLENPSKQLTDDEFASLIEEKLSGRPIEEFGVWVYYPWKNAIVHLLDEEDFIKVRTIRNVYKITPEQVELLSKKKIGVLGLSVGQAVVMSLVMERLCGEIRIADFDTLELSNLNRIRTGVFQLGLEKTEIVRREIAEIDPFIKVVVFREGIQKENIGAFLSEGGDLDLLVEECDSADVKMMIRLACRKKGIPVVMETSDRGLLDVERYDLDTNYPILHGLVEERFLQDRPLSKEEKMELLFQCFDASQASEGMTRSISELGKSITTWPQLASDVILGGAVVAMTTRMIFLTNNIKSSRTYVDVPSIIGK